LSAWQYGAERYSVVELNGIVSTLGQLGTFIPFASSRRLPGSSLTILLNHRGRRVMPDQKPYGKWTREELLGAESTARQFLQDNGGAIAETMRAKAKYLDQLIQRVAHPRTSFDD